VVATSFEPKHLDIQAEDKEMTPAAPGQHRFSVANRWKPQTLLVAGEYKAESSGGALT